MKGSIMISALNIVVLLAAALPVEAQYGGAGSEYDFPLVLRSSTVQEGAQRGLADLLRSQGQQAVLNAEAAVRLAEAHRKWLENREAAVESYYETRQRAAEWRQAERGPRPDAETIARLARARRPDRLGPDQLERLTGRLHWPVLLRSEAFTDVRSELELLFDRRAYRQYLDTREYLRVRELSGAMQTSLTERIREVPANDYIQAKRFLESVVYEASQPAESPWGIASRR